MTGVASAARVRALLGGPEYARVFAEVRAAIEARGENARSVALEGLDDRERRALAGLLGSGAEPAGPVRLELSRLDRALVDSAAGAGLREVLHALGGPVRSARAERRGRRERLERMWAAARQEAEARDRPELSPWLDGLRRSGHLLRAAKLAGRAPEDLLDEAFRAALQLPASGELLAVFAARTLGDSHALDAGSALGGLVLRAAAALAAGGGAADPTASSSEERRRLWRAVGIDCDALSSDVLVLGLRPRGDGLAARQLRECADAGEPRRLTLRELSRASLTVTPGSAVFVCENPAVVEAAADALGARAAPLVCVEGLPSVAGLALMKALAAGGARLRVHADLDWAGLRIVARVLLAAGGAEPWRMSAADHRAALAATAMARRSPATAPRRPGTWSSSPPCSRAAAPCSRSRCSRCCSRISTPASPRGESDQAPGPARP